MISVRRPLLVLGIALFALGSSLSAAERAKHEYLLHLPGIAGEQNLDRRFVRGLAEGGYAGSVEIYDWPKDEPGLNALLARKRNEREAQVVADRIQQILKEDSKAKIRLVGHSGGAGIAAWALERLPEDAQIETLVMIAPALSQRYDLSKALSRVRGKAYAFTSENDVIILGAGTRVFGTIDGVKEEAAGLRGFTMPEGADEQQYKKLAAMPYVADWMQFDNLGDHIGPMSRLFAAKIIAPLIQEKPEPAKK